jgi:hypothetical protein
VSPQELKADSGRGVFVQKQTANIYTMLLVLTFLALVVGCIFLYLEMKAYDMQVRVPPELHVSQAVWPWGQPAQGFAGQLAPAGGEQLAALG